MCPVALYEFYLYDTQEDFVQGRWVRRVRVERGTAPALTLDVGCSDVLGVALSERYKLRRTTTRDNTNSDAPTAHYVLVGIVDDED